MMANCFGAVRARACMEVARHSDVEMGRSKESAMSGDARLDIGMSSYTGLKAGVAAAVDGEDDAGDIAGGFRGEVDGGPADVIGSAEAFNLDAALDLAFAFGIRADGATKHGRVDPSGG